MQQKTTVDVQYCKKKKKCHISADVVHTGDKESQNEKVTV